MGQELQVGDRVMRLIEDKRRAGGPQGAFGTVAEIVTFKDHPSHADLGGRRYATVLWDGSNYTDAGWWIDSDGILVDNITDNLKLINEGVVSMPDTCSYLETITELGDVTR